MQKKSVVEFVVFDIGLGVLAGIAAMVAVSSLGNAPQLWGFDRSLALGLPLMVIAFAFIASALAFAVMNPKRAILCSIGSAALAAAFYFVFEISTIGFFGARLVSALVYAMPVAASIRAYKAFNS